MGAPVNGYLQARAFARHALWQGLVLTADVDGTWLAQPVNGERAAVLAGASATWALPAGWSVHLSGLVGTTPLYRVHSELIARVSYDFTLAGGAR